MAVPTANTIVTNQIQNTKNAKLKPNTNKNTTQVQNKYDANTKHK